MMIEERVLQVEGHLFKYNAVKDANEAVAPSSFLCIDRMAGDSKHRFMFHVTDKAQTVSYTRTEIESKSLNYSFSEVEKLLMWIGQPRAGAAEVAEVPAWAFKIVADQDVQRLKGVLAKVIYETNLQHEMDKACEEENTGYLEA